MGLWSRHGIPRAPGGEAPDSPGADEVSCAIQGGRGMPSRASDKKGSLNQKLFNSFFNMNRGRFLDHCLIGEHSSRGVQAPTGRGWSSERACWTPSQVLALTSPLGGFSHAHFPAGKEAEAWHQYHIEPGNLSGSISCPPHSPEYGLNCLLLSSPLPVWGLVHQQSRCPFWAVALSCSTLTPRMATKPLPLPWLSSHSAPAHAVLLPETLSPRLCQVKAFLPLN